MSNTVTIVGAGLAGSEAALNLASRGISVRLVEMRPAHPTAVHHTGDAAELVCSNSLKSTKPDSAAGLLKAELATLGSPLIAAAKRHAVAAGGALAVDRALFARDVTRQLEESPCITMERREATDIPSLAAGSDAIVLASGPLTSDALSSSLMALTGRDALAFYDAAAPVVMADSIDFGKVFRQSRYEDADAGGDYLNAPFTREEYDAFIVACHSDPNLEVLQAITDKPVVGIAEASMKIASMNCHSFAVISPSARSISPKRALARKYLCQDLYRGAEVCPENDSENLCRAAERAVEHSHVDGIVLGCANYANADAYIERKLGVKVFDGVACALMLAAGLAMYRRYRNEWKEGEEH